MNIHIHYEDDNCQPCIVYSHLSLFLRFIYLFILKELLEWGETEREKEKDLPFTGLLARWPK